MKLFTFVVNKVVPNWKDPSKPIERKANVSLNYAESIQDCLELCEGTEADVVAWFNASRRNWARTDAGNDLLVNDEIIRNLRKTAKSMVALTGGDPKNKDQVSRMINTLAASPEVAPLLANITFETEVTRVYEDPLPVPNPENTSVGRPPKSQTDDDEETDEDSDETTA